MADHHDTILTAKRAGYPFDHPKADVILRSSGDPPVDFRLFKLLLSLASPFFDVTFTLPQPDSVEDDLPVILMSEDKHTLEILLRLCYPISVEEPMPITSLKDLQLVIQAAMKLEMEGIQKYTRKVLLEPRFIESQPLRVFAIACRYGWAAEARKAARFTLRQPITVPFVEELEYISAAIFYRLQEYHRRCGDIAASRILELANEATPDDDRVWTTCLTCPRAGGRNRKRVEYGPGRPGPRKWWVAWMIRVSEEVRGIPWGETVKKYDLMKAAAEEAKECIVCKDRATEDLEDFSHILSAEIERAISSISLQSVELKD
ncbi:hypothetical protein BDZ94DRAFT_1252231 [Collybia nuda]|uniref:BTB domain-containing protein n=1 Tax=Collybia nuda TaxID=64659 RepID=A0A9P5YCB3_9AGAR|nr:hypothetical protein BDZ94DRAFT_1252231 [Collybia nuda]